MFPFYPTMTDWEAKDTHKGTKMYQNRVLLRFLLSEYGMLSTHELRWGGCWVESMKEFIELCYVVR